MNKKQTDRLSKQQVKGKGVKGIFGTYAQEHDKSVKNTSKLAFESLKESFPNLEFRYREKIGKSEIKKLNSIDNR